MGRLPQSCPVYYVFEGKQTQTVLQRVIGFVSRFGKRGFRIKPSKGLWKKGVARYGSSILTTDQRQDLEMMRASRRKSGVPVDTEQPVGSFAAKIVS